MNVFDYQDYKKYLTETISRFARRGLITELSRAAGCTQSYLSQVVHGSPELTPDQALGVAEFLGLKGDETDYFLLMVQVSRASTPKLRNHLLGKMKALKAARLQVSSAVAQTNHAKLEESGRDLYYSTWVISAVHMLTACPEYQRVEAIAARLSISLREGELALESLLKLGLVKKTGARFIHNGKNLHLPKESVYNYLNNLNWRMKGLQRARDPESVHYTSAFAINKRDWDVCKSKLLSFVEELRTDISESGSEDVYVFCCDLFRV